jgi:mRNA export factor
VQDGITTFSAGCDGAVRMWNPTQGPSAVQVIGRHDQPVKSMKFLPKHNVLVTGSWDRTVRVWDTRQPTAAATLQHPERVYAMDAKEDAIVVGTADRQVHVYNVANINNKMAQFESSLKYQTRCISIFHDLQGFAMGCIEGRVAIEYFEDMQKKIQNAQTTAASNKLPVKNFVFKCHRDNNNIYSVNAIDFHHYNTFCTAGSDGTFCWWDKDARHRLAAFEKDKLRCPITVAKFNPMGNMMLYALSYDWSKGAEQNNPQLGNNIVYHPVVDDEIAPKDRKKF